MNKSGGLEDFVSIMIDGDRNGSCLTRNIQREEWETKDTSKLEYICQFLPYQRKMRVAYAQTKITSSRRSKTGLETGMLEWRVVIFENELKKKPSFSQWDVRLRFEVNRKTAAVTQLV